MLDWVGFTEWNYWHWLILGAALLLLELFGTAGLLLWTGIAALLTAVMVYLFALDIYAQWGLFALDIYAQWGLFAIFSIATTWYWLRLNQRDKPAAGSVVLNQRTQRCIGAQTTLLEDVQLGQSRVRLDDTVWQVLCNEPLKAGTAVKVVAAEGTLLIVEAKTIS
jgi:membrane protein implicated in regulation of membrane protease activity